MQKTTDESSMVLLSNLNSLAKEVINLFLAPKLAQDV